MAKVWVLDHETKGTGAEMVPLEKVIGETTREPVRRAKPRRRAPAVSAQAQPRFRVVDVMTREVLAEGTDTRNTLDALREVRSLVDVSVYVHEDGTSRWRPLTLSERQALWRLRGAEQVRAARSGYAFSTRRGGGMATDIHDQLTKYLTDAHSIEEQALAQLRSAPDAAGDPQLAAAYREHLSETEGHERTVRELLDDRGAAPSRVKDAVMAAGGKGFLLFAALQPDTPGKLHAHSVSYEALELSAYEMLQRVAVAAGESEVAAGAERIAGEERQMIERLESTYDLAVEASLREVGRDDMTEQLKKYLADAHAIEEQATALLERAPKLAGSATLATIYSEHLDETREHARAVEARLEALGGSPSALKDAALRLGGLNWGTFFRAHPDTPGKLAAFARAFEHLEIGGYEQLRRVASRAGDTATAQLAERILAQERQAAERLAGAFDEAAAASLEKQGVRS